jgi:predicted signal transduction protein with EAL and GGDEF domain
MPILRLKRAKTPAAFGGHFYFSRSMGVEIRERVRMMHALRSGFQRAANCLSMYQPQVDLAHPPPGGRRSPAALAHWKMARSMSPDRFIPIAEYSGLIVEMGGWVLRDRLPGADARCARRRTTWNSRCR